jgi:hypothetical protein
MTTKKKPRNPDHVRSRRISAPTSEQIEEHLGLLLKPAVYSQLASYPQGANFVSSPTRSTQPHFVLAADGGRHAHPHLAASSLGA